MPAFTALRTRQRELLESAEAVASKAATADPPRELTEAERKQVLGHLEEARSIGSQIKAVEDRASKDHSTGPWVAAIRAAGAKTLLPSGSITVPAPWMGAIAGGAQIASLLGSVIPTTNLDDSDAFSYLRKVGSTNNAAPVAPGALKPTSVTQLEKIEDRAKTIATLSEPIPNQWLRDSRQLEAFLDGELRAMVTEEINSQVVNGTGIGEDLMGLLNVSGRQVQAFDTSQLVTIRKARTLIGAVREGLVPDRLLVNPLDAEDLDLSQDDEGRFYFGGPVGGNTDQTWRVPVRETNAVPEGVGVMAPFRVATLGYVRDEMNVDWSEAVPIDVEGTLHAAFELNQRVYRAEARVGLAILIPAAIVEVDLGAGS